MQATGEPDSAIIEPQLFAQALAVLERERPTRRATLLFKVLNWLVFGALFLTALYAVQVLVFAVTLSRAQPIAVAAAVVYVLTIPVSVLNVGFFNQLRRARTLQRMLAPSWNSRLQTLLRARREQNPVANLIAVGLTIVGGLAFAFGGIGLVVELLRQPMIPAQLALALVLTFFGVTLVMLPYMARGRERLQVIAEVRASLINGEVPAYDEVARLDRERSQVDRERSIRAQATRSRRGSYRYQESRGVRDAKQALESSVLVAVLAHVHRLIAHPRGPARDEASQGSIHYDRIDGTDLELGYSIDHAAREIRLLSLVQEDSPRPAPSDRWQPGDPEYKVNLSPSVRASDRVLSVEEQKAADEIIGTLAEDPSGCAHLAAPIAGGQLIRRHPSPSLEVTYSVDDARKTVNVVHVSAPIQAGRTLFVSYSHEDKEWWTKVMTYVRQLEAEGLIRIWSDDLIKAGERWNNSIMEALNSSQAALLLVSQHFINSTFINDVELPRILERAAQGVTKIFWVPVRVSTVFTTHKTITDFQSLLVPPTTPLNKLEEEGESKCDEALLQIYENLRRALVG